MRILYKTRIYRKEVDAVFYVSIVISYIYGKWLYMVRRVTREVAYRRSTYRNVIEKEN